MELGAALGPLVRSLLSNPRSLLSSSTTTTTNHGRSSASVLDRALGTAVTLGFVLVVYRTLYVTVAAQQDDGDNEDEGENQQGKLPKFWESVMRVILRHILSRRNARGGGGVDGDLYFKTAYSNSADDDPEDGNDDVSELFDYMGSCHCRSVQFKLKAPKRLSAFDCLGKIRYPHYRTTERQFELTAGGEHLSVYYVTLPSNSDESSGNELASDSSSSGANNELLPPPPRNQTTIAAHVFCTRCGVHILRAPDSNSELLEVNINCLEPNAMSTADSSQVPKHVAPHFTFYENDRAMGSGIPSPNQWQTHPPQTRPSTVHNPDNEGSQNDIRVSAAATSDLRAVRAAALLNNNITGTDENAPSSAEMPPSTPSPDTTHSRNDLETQPGTPSTSATVGSESFAMAAQQQQPLDESLSSDIGSTSENSTSANIPQIASSPAAILASAMARENSPVFPPPKVDSQLQDWSPSSGQSLWQQQSLQATPKLGSSTATYSDRKNNTSIALRDQLKYYITKHLNDAPNSPSSHS